MDWLFSHDNGTKTSAWLLTNSLLLYRYLLRPLESLTSLLNTRDISNRKRCRSRPFRIRVLGSQTWKDSWSISSPWESMFPSNPKMLQEEEGTSGSVASAAGQKHLGAACGLTLQHRQVHGVVGFLRDAEHHFQSVLDLTFSLLAACQQLLRETDANSILTIGASTFYKAFEPALR